MKAFLRFVVLFSFVATVGCGDGSTGSKGSPGAGGSISGSGGAITTGLGGNAAIGAGTGGAVASGGNAVIGAGTGGAVGTGGSAAGGSGSGGTSKADASAGGGDAADARIANADQARAQADGTVGGNICPAFEACGGNVVGTWYFRSECIEHTNPPWCPGYEVSFGASDTPPAYTFKSDGTFTVSTAGGLRARIRYPIACLHSDAAAVQACSDFQDSVRQSLPGLADAGTPTTVAGFTCWLESDETCLCNEDLSTPAGTSTGTYWASGGQLSLTLLTVTPMPDGGLGDAGTDELVEYCVSGDTLTLGVRAATSPGSIIVTMTK